MHPSLTPAPDPRVLLTAADIWSPGIHLTSGTLAPATALPLALSGPSLAYARDPGNGPRLRPGRTVPGGDRSGLWLRNAAAGLCVLAAAAAAVSFTAQYRMVDATRHLPADRRPGGRDPRRRRPGLRLPRHRPGPARPPRAPRPGAEPGRGRDQRVHERDRRRSGLAEPGHLGHAPHRLRPGQRHPDRRRPRLGSGPPPATWARRWPPTRPPRWPSSAG